MFQEPHHTHKLLSNGHGEHLETPASTVTSEHPRAAILPPLTALTITKLQIRYEQTDVVQTDKLHLCEDASSNAYSFDMQSLPGPGSGLFDHCSSPPAAEAA